MKTLLLALALLVTSVPALARTLDQIKASGKLVAATEGAFSPFNYFDNGKLTGFEVELAEKLAQKMGLKIEWKTVGFDALLTGLAQDRWDLVIASHGITDERAKAVTFTAPHYCSGGIIVAKGSAKAAQSIAGKVVAVQTGSTYFDNVKKIGTAKDVRNFPSDVDARAALATGRVDLWVTDRFTALETARKNPDLQLKLGGEMLFTERIAAATAKGNTALADAWNKALAAALADGSYGWLATQYFGQDVRCKP